MIIDTLFLFCLEPPQLLSVSNHRRGEHPLFSLSYFHENVFRGGGRIFLFISVFLGIDVRRKFGTSCYWADENEIGSGKGGGRKIGANLYLVCHHIYFVPYATPQAFN